MDLPVWSDTIRRLYLSGAANQFILHGNVQDRFPIPSEDSLRLGSLGDFLLYEQLRRFDIVIGYELGSGIRVLAGETLFRQIAPPIEPPVDPPGAIAWIDHLLRRCVNLRSIASGNPEDPSPAGRNYHVAVIIASAELSFPAAPPSSRDYTLHSVAAVVRSWSRESYFLEQNLAVFLLTEQSNDLHRLLIQNSRAALVEIGLPDEKTLGAVFRAFTRSYPRALSYFSNHPEVPASRFVGATIAAIESLLKQRDYQQAPLEEPDLGDWKKSLVEKDAQGLIEFLEPTRTLNDFSGSDAVKAWLRQDIALWQAEDLAAMPMGYLLSGPVGTGKTFLVECLAGEAGIPVVKLKNFRDRWVGSTEGNLERIFGFLRALGRCFVFVDEADQALGGRESGNSDSGLSGRIYSMMAKEMGNTDNRGRIVWILASSRPDLIEVDLKRPGRVDVKFPLFPALGAADGYELIRALGKKYQMELPRECPANLLPLIPPLITPGTAESIAVKVYRELRTSGVNVLEALENTLDEYLSPIPESTMRFQIGLAAAEASDLAFVPLEFRSI